MPPAPPRGGMAAGMEAFAAQMMSKLQRDNKDILVTVQPSFTDAVQGFYHAVRWDEVRAVRRTPHACRGAARARCARCRPARRKQAGEGVGVCLL